MDRLSLWVAGLLLNSLWQVTLVAVAATLADRWLRGAPAGYRHALWALGLAAAVLLPAASTRSLAPRAAAPADTAALAAAASPQDSRIPGTRPAGVDTKPSVWKSALTATHRSVRVPRSLARGTLAAYLLFLVLMAIRLARAGLRTRQIRRLASAHPGAGQAAGTLQRCLSLMAGRPPRTRSRVPDLLWSAHVAGPVTVGARRPAIILPARLLEPGAQEDLTAALAHEVAHVLRRDYLRNLLYELLSLPLAFHPLVGLIKRRLVESRELACDELAARVLDPALYARCLVRMAYDVSRFPSPGVPRPDYTLGVFDADILEERVMRLMKPRSRLRLAKLPLAMGVLLMGVCSVAAARFPLGVAESPHMNSPAGQDAALGPQADRAGPQLPTNVIMPKLEDGATEATITKWRKEVGDKVDRGEPLFGISTDKSGPAEIASPAAGILTKILVAENQAAKANAVVAEILGDGPAAGVSGGVSGGITGGPRGGVTGGPVGGPRAPGESENKTGSLPGIVVDSRGARIPRAEVRLISRNNSFTQSTESSETGDFSFGGVPAGRYTLEVSSPGMGGSFRSFDFKAEGEPPFFPFVLHPGNVTESVVVTAKAPATPSKAVPMGPRRIRVGGMVQAAKLIESPPPEYPESARSQGLQGVVLLQATISPEGVPTELKVLGSPGEDLTKAAMDAVSQWRYQPTLLNAEPVEVITTITVNFQLDN